MAGTSECGNEPSGSIKRREFLDWAENQLASQEVKVTMYAFPSMLIIDHKHAIGSVVCLFLLLVSMAVKHNVLLNLITGCLYWLTTCFGQLHDDHQVYKS